MMAQEMGKEMGIADSSGALAIKTTNRRRHAPSEPMYVRYAKEFQVEGEPRLELENKLLRRINRFIVYYLGAYFCDLDFEATQCNQAARSSSGTGRAPALRAVARRLGGLKRSNWKRRLRFGWIPRALLVCFCLLQAHLMVTSYYQYRYDFDVLRLVELQKRGQQAGGEGGREGEGNGTQARPYQLQRYRQMNVEIKSRMAKTKTTLDWLGSDYSHLTILVECFYLIVGVLALLMYVPLYVHHRFQAPFDNCHIVRDLVDRRREVRRSKRMVERQVDKFLDSSRVYYENAIGFPDTPLGAWQAGAAAVAVQSPPPLPPGDVAPSSRATKREQEIVDLARDMLACGALTPLHRLRSLIRMRTLLQFGIHFGQTSFSISFVIIFTGGFVWFASDEEHNRGKSIPMQLLSQLVTLKPLIIALPNMIVHPPLVITLAIEHIQYIEELRSMIRECISVNSLIARQLGRHRLMLHGQHQLVAEAAGYGEDAERDLETKLDLKTQKNWVADRIGAWQFRGPERTMNSNLIFVLLHYKIFVAQLTPMRHSLGVKFLVALSLLFLVPITTRIHQPYVRNLYEGRLTDAQVRIFAFLISVSPFLPVNLICVPTCHMVARCKCLYRDLASLMAHISEVKLLAAAITTTTTTIAQGSSLRATSVYDCHTQSVLMKEISDSKRLLEHLQVHAGGISGNYTNLIKALLWFGLIAISTLAERDSYSGEGQGELLSELFNDPLGVYSELK